MNTIATCAQRFKAIERSYQNCVIPYYPALTPHWLQTDPPYVNLDLVRRRTIPKTWGDGLCYVWLQIEGLMNMVQVSRKSKKKQPAFDWEMIQFKLKAEELAEFEETTAEAKYHFISEVTDLLLDDHKVGVSWDAYNDCFISSITAKGEDHLNAGKTLLSRSTLWEESVALGIYKVRHIYKNGVWVARLEDTQRG